MGETMRRRVPVQNIRGSDPTLLEVQLQDLLRRPMSQLAPVNVLDLIALAETEGRPRSLERSLQLFVERVSASIADLPAGQAWEEFLAEIEHVEGSRVPHRFRQILERETQRDDRDEEEVFALLTKWGEQDPVPFELGQEKARVTRAVAADPPEDRPERKRAGTPRAKAAPRQPKTITEEDRDRNDWIAETVLERVAGAGEKGLGEQVLIAGVRHRARELYPMLTPIEITTVLKALKETGRVRYSAGRWSAPARW